MITCLAGVKVENKGLPVHIIVNTQPYNYRLGVFNTLDISYMYAHDSDIANSSWSTEGVTTTDVIEDKERGVFEVFCESTHFTAFAVLMDVTGVLNVCSSLKSYTID